MSKATKNQSDYYQRSALLRKIENRFEIPMLILSFVWLVLMILELTVGLSPILIHFNNFIWFLFVVDFLVQFILAPSKSEYLKRGWITAVALILPAFRILRIFRAARLLRASGAIRALRLARVLTSLNRGVTALGKSLSRRGVGYVLGLTLIVLMAGAAGILSFEKGNGPIEGYGTSLWWTAMVLTTMGSDFFPKTTEGRFLCLILAIYGFAVFGYVTAVVATFFIGEEAKKPDSEFSAQQSIKDLQNQILSLRDDIRKSGKFDIP